MRLFYSISSLILAMSLCPFIGCAPSASTYEVEIVKISELNRVDYSTCLNDAKTVLLNDSNDESFMLSDIGRVVYKESCFYIMDPAIGKIVVFDESGEPLRCFSRQGRGEQEYLMLTDFDISSSGEFVIMDGRKKTLLFYDAEGVFSGSIKLPFAANAFVILDNGNFLFNLAPWNEESGSGCKLAITDEKMNLLDSQVEYAGLCDPDFTFESMSLCKSKDVITFNQPIDDDVFVLGKDGSIIKTIRFDFGSETVPEQARQHVEQYYSEFANYSFLANAVSVSGKLIAGTLRDKGTYRDFFIDTDKKTMAVQDEQHAHLRFRGVSGGLAVFQDTSLDGKISLKIFPFL